ncbi:hypothetical protein N7532_011537 [Penicillium argentinense]|uniref:Spindle pole body component n=1 Tax=Penicillium argentinense TaxID=1131581 RepID=A0A9W9EIS2_9EURO|nr:uncharacterized protein N7532_011537 [Penicillium argentinense]KAJ5082494.1 hypothetical protein N7532_011537 [Penicillium argentinense]
MDSGDSEPDAFSTESLWRLSRFSIEVLQPLESLPWNADLPAIPKACFQGVPEPNEQVDPIWKLNLFPNDLEHRELVDSIIDPSIDNLSDTPSDLLPNTIKEDNIWSLSLLQEEPGYFAPLKSWEKYQDRAFKEPVSAYFSESGAKGFDAVLSRQGIQKGQVTPNRMAREDVFIRSLLRLGLGWSSWFFSYNQKTKLFEKSVANMRVSGLSSLALDGVISEVLHCGTLMQWVRAFAKNSSTKSKDLSALFTLRGTIAVIVYNLEKQILSQCRNIVSALQVSTLFRRCRDLLGVLAEIVHNAEKATSEAEVISNVMEQAAQFSHTYGWMENLLHEMVVQITLPWFGFIEGWIGLRPAEAALDELIASGRSFVQLERHNDPNKFRDQPTHVEYTYRQNNMPSFVPFDQAESIFESGRSLRLLKKSHPYHPLARHDVLDRAGRLRLHCATTWADIERIQRNADEYETRLRAEILKYHRGESLIQPMDNGASPEDTDVLGEKITKETFEMFDIDDEKHISGSAMDRAALANENVDRMLQNARDFDSDPFNPGSQFGPELASALYLSLAPVISSQAQLIDFSCLHHLFKEHRLRHHLDLQWRFQLLGDGSFTTRLTNSLFDPEMESGERKAGVVRSGVHTGLRLGSRDTWPPASSELRLVLMGLLGDCYFGDVKPDSDTAKQSENELPGGLSFGIRELSPEEIKRCQNPNAIEALDFLRLQYKPPEALEVLITPQSLKKYDRLFNQLLRLLRILSVVKGLIRDSTSRNSIAGDIRNVFQRFRVDAQFFVLAICDYCFHIGIGSIWIRFQETLSKIERCLDRGDADGTIEAAHSVTRLRYFHEDILDQMLFALFLSKRHAPAAKLLDSIFSTILAFGPLSKADGTNGVRHENEAAVHDLYRVFRKHTSAFVGYLRSLDTGKASSKSMAKSGASFSLQNEPTSVFEHLRVKLEMRDYY